MPCRPGRAGGSVMAESKIFSDPIRRDRDATTERPLIRLLLIALALIVMALFLLLPTLAVFAGALGKGIPGILKAFRDADTLAAIRLTMIVAAISVPINSLFGLSAAWAVARFQFPGKSVLV